MRRPRLHGQSAPILLAFAMLFAPRTCRSEWLYFVGGGQVQAPVRRTGDQVRVVTPFGQYSFRDKDFRAIVPGGCPDQEWEARRDAVSGAAAERQFAAAWWALENGLIPECVSLLRSTHAAHPDHSPTARLVETLDRLGRPCSDPEADALRGALKASCEVERGPHIYLLHQHNPVEARARVDVLERVTTAYYLVLAAHGLDLKVPSRRLVSVSLRDRNDYLAFLASQDANAFRSTLGYFHPIFRAVITFNPGPGGAPDAGRDGRDAANREAPMDRGGATGEPPPSDAERRRLFSDLANRARSDGTAAHEMIHLLVSESRLAPDPGEFPLWLHEGFAAQFEVIRGGRWAGVGRAHDLRLPDYRSATPPAALETLIRDNGFGRGYRRDLYANSWSLVYFLRKTRPREFSAFLDLLRSPAAETVKGDPSRFDATFRTAFGDDLRGLESEWRAFVGKVLTPLEEHDPARSPVPPLLGPGRSSAPRAGVRPESCEVMRIS